MQTSEETKVLNEAREAWKKAATRSSDAQTTALGFRGNLRLNARALFGCVWHIGKVCLKVKTAIVAGHANPLELLEIGAEAFSAITGALAAFYQKLNAAEYLACVFLSQAPNGVKKDEFATAFESFLTSYSKVELPWYVRVNTKDVEKAQEFLKKDGAKILEGKEIRK